MINLWRFADRWNIPWNLPTNFHSDLIATIQQRYLPLLWALLSQQSHLFLICVALTYNDSRIIPHKTCQIPRNCECKWLLVSSSAPGTSSGSFGSPGKFLFYTGRTVTTGSLSLVPPRRIGDCSAIHFLHSEFCDLQLSNLPKSPLWAQLYQHAFCKKPSFFFCLRVLRKVRAETTNGT